MLTCVFGYVRYAKANRLYMEQSTALESIFVTR